MRITSTAVSGMRAGMARMDAAASTIASQSGVDAVSPVAAIQTALPDGGVAVRLTSPSFTPADPVDALVETMEAGLTYSANARVMRAADSMMGSLLDMKA